MKTLISYSIQFLVFVVIYTTFLAYFKYREGTEYSKYITNGAKLYRDENGVKLNNNKKI